MEAVVEVQEALLVVLLESELELLLQRLPSSLFGITERCRLIGGLVE